MRSIDQIENDIRSLPFEDQLNLLDRVSTAMVPDDEEFHSVKEAMRRKAEWDADPSIGISLEELKANLGRT